MKYLLIVLLLVPVSLVACPKGSYEYNGGCEMDIQPQQAPSVKPSEERPPSDKMPSYQREGVKVIDVPNMAGEDAKLDREKVEADRDGKKAAGLK